MSIALSVSDLIGHTPLLELCRIERELNLHSRLICKLELMNPAGSAKDRVALQMINDAERRGALKPGATIVEPTSGNTGIGLASVAVSRGYKVVLTMPDTMSVERRKLLAAYGARLVLTDGKLGMRGAIDKARELCGEIEGSFMPSQFDNPANPEAHFLTTGEEIWLDTDGAVDIFVAGVGTGGTITGVGRALRAHKPDVRIVAVEPDKSPVLSGGNAGSHKLQGIGAGFVPSILDTKIYDEVLTVTADEAFAAGRLIARLEGVLVGISSGAALSAAITLARRKENADKTIVALLPDTGERYLSSEMFEERA